VNSNSIDREQSFQTTVNRDSDVVVNTSSSPIGIGVSRSWTCVDDIVKSGLCVSAEPRHSASTGNRNPSSGSRWSAAASIRKIGRKTAEEVGAGAHLLGNPLVGRAHWSGLRTKGCLAWHNVRADPLHWRRSFEIQARRASVMLGRFRERFSKGLCESLEIRSSRGPPFRETWLGNPIFWIEVVGGTLDPKNWIKT